MDLEQRLNHLESHHDWQGLTEALEQSIVSSEDASVKADLHLRLGRLLHTRFLQGVKALKHFQDAYKLNPALVEALAEARLIYWELGKLNMVQKLLELQLKNTEDPTVVGALYRELGDVHCDLGDYERAADAYAHALSCGATPVKQPEKVFWGGYSGYFADPDGHLWELAFNPFAPNDADGFMLVPE